MRWWLFLLVLFLCPVEGRAQTTWVLDPDDAITYKEWAKKEAEMGLKMIGPAIAAKVVGHATYNASEVPTPETGVSTDNGAKFWTYHAPEWVKRFSKNPFATQPAGGNQATITKMFQGLTIYQKARVSLRTMALLKSCLAGMRFEINAWQMMRNIDFTQYEASMVPDVDGVVALPGGSRWTVVSKPLGVVSLGIVPRGRANWRQVTEYFQDDPTWDGENRSRITFKGPRSFGDLNLEAEEAYVPVSGNMGGDIANFLEAADRATRAAGEGLAAIRTMVSKRVGEAMRDADSPRNLAEKLKQLAAKRNQAFDSLIALRAYLEARPINVVASEYGAMTARYIEDAQAAYRQAEASANFYQQLSAQADNAVAFTMNMERAAEIKKLEDKWAKMVNGWNGQVAQDEIKEFLKFTGKWFPSLVPYLNAIELPWDVAAIVKGDANQSADDQADPTSDVYRTMRDYQARMFAVRFGYYFWEELRACRKLLYVLELEKVAAKGIENDPESSQAHEAALFAAHERELALTKLKMGTAGLQAWRNNQILGR